MVDAYFNCVISEARQATYIEAKPGKVEKDINGQTSVSTVIISLVLRKAGLKGYVPVRKAMLIMRGSRTFCQRGSNCDNVVVFFFFFFFFF